MTRRGLRSLPWFGLALGLALGPAHAAPPRPDEILGTSLTATPPIDATTPCPPARLETNGSAAGTRGENADDGLDQVREEAARAFDASSIAKATTAAREAMSPEELEAALRTLRAPLLGASGGTPRRCALLERSRLELMLGLLPEAGASARRAARDLENGALAPVREAALFLRAEALYLGGRPRQARPLYVALADSGNPRLAPAARLRLADLRFDAGAARLILTEYQTLLERSASFGADALAWAPRAAEAALAGGDLASARVWLERLVEDSDGDTDVHRIRLGDVAAAEGNLEESRNLFTDVDGARDGDPIGLIARIRVFDHGVADVPAPRVLEALREIIGATLHLGVASYGRVVLAHRLLEAGEIDEALASLIRVSYENLSPALVRVAAPHLQHALRLAAEDATGRCGLLLLRLGSQRELLLRRARSPEPFIRLGSCYEELGLPLQALDVYRGLTRAFGAAVTERVSLPIARASLAARDFGTARAAAAARLAAGSGDRVGWTLVLAETHLEEGLADAALERLVQLVKGEEPAPPRALLLLARAASATPPAFQPRRLIYNALLKLDAEDFDELLDFAETAYRAAGLFRREGDIARALRLYERALSGPLPDAMRSEVAYWIGVNAGPGRRARAALEEASRADVVFGAIAANRAKLDRARRSVGLASWQASR